MRKLTVPGFRDKGCFDCMSTESLVNHGEAMLENGWKVKYDVDDSGNTVYRWSSPRGATYSSYAVNVPHYKAVEDAVKHKDYQCTVMDVD